jgi:uncharacterized membrane protein (DUF373 family)|tara:strand:+ start:2181 stop:2393 length:213 start_codon:yes stop_codon:yes gene_type:complete
MLNLFFLVLSSLFVASILIDIAKYFLSGMPNSDFYVLPGGIFLILVVSPIIYSTSKVLRKSRMDSQNKIK